MSGANSDNDEVAADSGLQAVAIDGGSGDHGQSDVAACLGSNDLVREGVRNGATLTIIPSS